MELVTAELMRVEGVRDVHDLHIWSLGSESHALSCHIAIQDIPPSVSERILREVQGRLRAEFSIQPHQPSSSSTCVCDIEHGCVVVPDRRQRVR